MLRKLLTYVSRGIIIMISFALVGVFAILGIDEPWVVDQLVGADNIRDAARRIELGQHSTTLRWVFLSISVVLFLAISIVFLLEPVREALRRYRTRNGIFLSDRKLAREMQSLAKELREFIYERSSSRPGGRDHMNFAIGAPPVDWPGYMESSMIVGPDADSVQLRVARQKIEERAAFDEHTSYIFFSQFASRVLVVIDELSARKILPEQEVSYIRFRYIHSSVPLPQLKEFCAIIEAHAHRILEK